MDKHRIEEIIITAIKEIQGIEDAFRLKDEDRAKLHDIEKDAEKKSLMGLGKVINTGVETVLQDDRVYVALTNMSFDWGKHSTLRLKKGREVVGEEIRDKERMDRLSKEKNVWFMHKNFVVYKDRISFPGDIMKKNCHFEIPCIPVQWCMPEDLNFRHDSIRFANPAVPCDVYLKEKYFGGIVKRELGTILIGIHQDLTAPG